MQRLNAFFDNYAKALEMYNSKGLSYMYNIPCTMVSDEATSIFNDGGKLEGFFNQGTTFYKQFGIAHARPEIWHKRPLSDKIVMVKVKWCYFDNKMKPIYNCDYYYTLKLDKNEQWKIILSVSANEKERMEEWQNNIKEVADDKEIKLTFK